MLFHISISLKTRGDLVNSKCDHKALGLRIKSIGTPVVFLVLQVRGKGLRRSEEEWRVSTGQPLAAQLVVITKMYFL